MHKSIKVLSLFLILMLLVAALVLPGSAEAIDVTYITLENSTVSVADQNGSLTYGNDYEVECYEDGIWLNLNVGDIGYVLGNSFQIMLSIPTTLSGVGSYNGNFDFDAYYLSGVDSGHRIGNYTVYMFGSSSFDEPLWFGEESYHVQGYLDTVNVVGTEVDLSYLYIGIQFTFDENIGSALFIDITDLHMDVFSEASGDGGDDTGGSGDSSTVVSGNTYNWELDKSSVLSVSARGYFMDGTLTDVPVTYQLNSSGGLDVIWGDSGLYNISLLEISYSDFDKYYGNGYTINITHFYVLGDIIGGNLGDQTEVNFGFGLLGSDKDGNDTSYYVSDVIGQQYSYGAWYMSFDSDVDITFSDLFRGFYVDLRPSMNELVLSQFSLYRFGFDYYITDSEGTVIRHDQIMSGIDGIQSGIDDANDKLDNIQGSINDTNDKLDDVKDSIDKVDTDLKDGITGIRGDLTTGFEQIYVGQDEIKDSIQSGVDQIIDQFSPIETPDSVRDIQLADQEFRDFLNARLGEMEGQVNGIFDNGNAIMSTVQSGIQFWGAMFQLVMDEITYFNYALWIFAGFSIVSLLFGSASINLGSRSYSAYKSRSEDYSDLDFDDVSSRWR